MIKKHKILTSIVCLSLVFSFISSAHAQGFDPNNIISDFEILDYTAMDLNDIKEFLTLKHGYIANYTCANPDGALMTASEIIYDRAITNKINPKFLLVLLQKEQSLIEDDDPTTTQLDWATGYGCPDSAPCNTRWQGFWKQLNSASLQFRDYMDNPQLYTYRAGGTYTFTNLYGTISKDPITVTPVNQATAALYNYTPHVYNGNYNFYNIWQRYFTKIYPDGTLMQAQGETGVWLLQDGKKRPFLTKGALTSRFDIKKVVQVNQSDLDKYATGAAIKFAEYSLLRSPRGTVFLLVGETKRGFTSQEALRKTGINPEEIVNASWDDLNTYSDGSPITATSTYPTGALLQNKTTGGVYWVIAGTKAPLIDKIFLTTKFKKKKIIKVAAQELDNYQTVSPVLFGDGELLKSNSSSAVYVISNGQKRPITDGKIFEGLGYKWENIITVSPQILYLYEQGEPITQIIENDI